ncbi:hypothetical protein OHC33_005986 [Knufia fluminis]|uniref:Uncharacterized protein n=1 Tax=Knufia fluminis TaxID=191047 RepID=A0AAN8I8A5_9EURO|nr:hypothetical protein OHC33_005986 [Knufia fluminis]
MRPQSTDPLSRAIGRELEQRIAGLQQQLDSAKSETLYAKDVATDLRKRRTQDRKEWGDEKAKRIALQKEVKTLKTTIAEMEAQQSLEAERNAFLRATSHSTIALETPSRTTEITDVQSKQGDNLDIDLLRLENKKLKSQQALLEDTMKENEALHRDKSASGKTITDLKDKITNLEINLEARTKDLDDLIKKHESAVKLSNSRAADIIKGNEKHTKLKQQIDKQSAELKKCREEVSEQKGVKRKLIDCPENIGITKDDFEKGSKIAKIGTAEEVSELRMAQARPVRLVKIAEKYGPKRGALAPTLPDLLAPSVEAPASPPIPEPITLSEIAPGPPIPSSTKLDSAKFPNFPFFLQRKCLPSPSSTAPETPSEVYKGTESKPTVPEETRPDDVPVAKPSLVARLVEEAGEEAQEVEAVKGE